MRMGRWMALSPTIMCVFRERQIRLALCFERCGRDLDLLDRIAPNRFDIFMISYADFLIYFSNNAAYKYQSCFSHDHKFVPYRPVLSLKAMDCRLAISPSV